MKPHDTVIILKNELSVVLNLNVEKHQQYGTGCSMNASRSLAHSNLVYFNMTSIVKLTLFVVALWFAAQNQHWNGTIRGICALTVDQRNLEHCSQHKVYKLEEAVILHTTLASISLFSTKIDFLLNISI